jgi:U3 small nucleolar RNA-associated protein 14
MVDSSIQEAEELRMNHLSLEEVKARRAELRKMRDLLFRAEVKAKRLSKIKSKTYRRLKKKGKQKLMDKLGSDEDENEEKKIKKEVERAKERATLKHKNTGKWAKAMKARGELDEDQKNDMLEMFERGEALRKKIRGDNDDDEDSDDDEMDLDQVKANAFEEISQLHDDDDVELPDSSKGKSIFEMKFMKNAAERENQKVQGMADDFLKEIGTISDEESQPTERESSNAAIQRIGGRVTYRPGVSVSQLADNI